MTQIRWLVVAILFGLVQVAMISTASAEEDFYWKNSYPRGVGTIPPDHACDRGKDEDAGLCYTPCKTGYHGVGPVCWQDKASYGRGAGTIPPCRDGKEKQAGLCYRPCKAGYHGKGPVCWHDGAASYGRGAGTPLKSVCGSGKEADAGLCYPVCKAGYDGIGPVCWGETPKGYVDCAAGFAKDKKTCAEITAGQVVAVAMLVGTVVPGVAEAKTALQAAKAKKTVDQIKKIKELEEKLNPTILTKLKASIKNLKQNLIDNHKGAALLDTVHQAWKALPAAEQQAIKVSIKGAKTSASITSSVMDEQLDPIDLLRDAVSAIAIVDQTGVMSVAAAFMYPVYGVDYGKL